MHFSIADNFLIELESLIRPDSDSSFANKNFIDFWLVSDGFLFKTRILGLLGL